MDVKQLILRAQVGEESALNEIVQINEKLVWSIAHRFKGRGVDIQDLFQIGSVGLIKAVQSYDESYGTEFSTYAVPKIMGEIKRFFRDDGMIKVSRDVKSKAILVNNVISRLQQENGGEVHLSDISRHTGMTAEEIVYIQSATEFACSLDAPLNDDGLMLKDSIASADNEENLLDRISVKTALGKLPEREKKVIILRYFRDMTQNKTAELLGMSQVQVSRTEKKALQMIKEYVS